MGCFPSNASRVSEKPQSTDHACDPGPPYDPNAAAAVNSNMNSDSNENSGGEAQIRNYFSFSSFILQNDEPVLFDWQFYNEIGKGAMSRVFLAQHVTNQQKCAAKVYNKGIISRPTLGLEEPPYIAVDREIQIQAHLDHRYVLSIIEVIDDDCSNSLIILMPFAENGTLQSYITSNEITENTLAICFYEVAEALRYIHSQNVVHRDLKPENILVFSPSIYVISDFSASTKLETDDEKLLDTKGSPAFLSPEECGGESFSPKPVSQFSVVYSINCHLILMKDKGKQLQALFILFPNCSKQKN